INLELAAGGHVLAGFAEVANLFATLFAWALDFKNLGGAPLGAFNSLFVLVSKIALGTPPSIVAFGEKPPDCGLPGPARADEQIGMGDASLFDGVGQGLRDMLLSHDIGEPLGPIFTGYDLIRHIRQIANAWVGRTGISLCILHSALCILNSKCQG